MHPKRFSRRWPAALLAASAALMTSGCATLPRDVPTVPAPGSDRFAAAQAALDALAARDPSSRGSFDFARAQCFVQHAFSAAHENDRSGFVPAALDQAEAITAALRSGSTAPATQLINHAEPMRPDLWGRAAQLRAGPGAQCAQASAGCLEVQLVRAGHEYASLGWRHANSHFAIAEDLAAKAQSEADACAPRAIAAAQQPAPARLPTPVTILVSPVAEPQPSVQAISFGADALFRFDRHEAGEVLAEGRRKLDEAAERLKSVELRSVRVIGYTDPLGTTAYNEALSLKRAATVRDLLVARGVPAQVISIEGRGPAVDALVQCDARKLRGAALRSCYQPLRRVVIEFDYSPR